MMPLEIAKMRNMGGDVRAVGEGVGSFFLRPEGKESVQKHHTHSLSPPPTPPQLVTPPRTLTPMPFLSQITLA